MSDPDQKITQETLVDISAANNYLAVNLHRLLAEENQNVFFSPFSLSTALAMLFCGTGGETAAEMRSVLGYDHAKIKSEDIASSFEDIVKSTEEFPDDYVLAIANSLLSQKDFMIKHEYRSLLCNSFKALLLEVDFHQETDEVLSQINDWVKEKTRNKIPKLLESLAKSTVLVLLNAVYFKGNWLNSFEKKATSLQPFYNRGVNAKTVDMMHLKKKFPYVANESFKALQLPYKGDEMAMVVLLPNSKDGLAHLESELTADFFRNLKQEMRNIEVEVTLPKFKLEYSKSMKECFQKMGLKRPFQCGADFGGISESKDMAVSEIVHKAVVEVNEEGSEAAAATAVLHRWQSLFIMEAPKFIVDHPFAFAIYNTKRNLIIFMGRVVEL